MKQTILNIGILLACMISAILPIKAQDPYLSAMKLRGNVSCLKVYSQGWKTEFGEVKIGKNKHLIATLYYDKNHRLLYANEAETEYNIINFYEYTYKDGTLSTIDCYQKLSDTYIPFVYKIRLVKENGITVGYLYDEYGREDTKYSPYYNVGCEYFWRYQNFFTQHLFYVFAFEIEPEKLEYDPYNEFNSKKQLIKSYDHDGYIVTYEYNTKGQLTVINIGKNYYHYIFDYDTVGNVKSIKRHNKYGDGNDSGRIYTFEYEYGNFDESEKFNLKRIEQEEARKDSIAAAKLQAREDSIANAKKQEWEQVQEFARAIKENKPENGKSLVDYFKYVYTITFDDNYTTKIPTQLEQKYSDDSGRKYYVYYNDDRTCMIFQPIYGFRPDNYLVRKEPSGSFKVYKF